MLSWFKRKRPLPEAAPPAEAAAPPPNETNQEIAAATDAAVPKIMAPEMLTTTVSDGEALDALTGKLETKPETVTESSAETSPSPAPAKTARPGSEKQGVNDGGIGGDANPPVSEEGQKDFIREKIAETWPATPEIAAIASAENIRPREEELATTGETAATASNKDQEDCPPLLEEELEELIFEDATEFWPAAPEVASEVAGLASAENFQPPGEELELEAVGETATTMAMPSGDEGVYQDEPAVASNEAASPSPERAPLFAAPQVKPAPKTGFFSRLAERLSRTRESFTSQLDQLLYGQKEIDRDLFEQLEELLITADLGYATTQEILDAAKQKVKHQDTDNPRALRDAIRDKMLDYLTRSEQDADLVRPRNGPFVIMAVGVNGVGKTTTIGKMAHKFSNAGYSVLLVAGDTFRAAAVSQLKIWGERGGIHVMAKDDGSDPSSVVFDALAHAVAKSYDVVLVDTAGRLHTQQHLMEELKKIKRVMAKKLPGAPHEVLLVLDATTGQNAIAQARIFNEAVGVTGIALTKLDGTAKGGIVINVSKELGAPIRFIGVGEQLADLRDFDAKEFIDALFDGGGGRKP